MCCTSFQCGLSQTWKLHSRFIIFPYAKWRYHEWNPYHIVIYHIYIHTLINTQHTYIYTYVWYIHSWYIYIDIHLYSTIYVDVYSTISCNHGCGSRPGERSRWRSIWASNELGNPGSQTTIGYDFNWISMVEKLRTTIFKCFMIWFMNILLLKVKTQFSMDEEQTQLLDLMLVYRSLLVRKPHTMDISTRNVHKIDDLSTINPKFGLMINQLTSRFGFPSCMVSRRLEETWWSDFMCCFHVINSYEPWCIIV